jgi:hypothetical protein
VRYYLRNSWSQWKFRLTVWQRKHSFLKPGFPKSPKERRITADTALRFAKYFGTSAKFWMGLQDDYDLEEEKVRIENELNDINAKEGNAA